MDTSTDPVDARAIRTAFGNLLGMPVRAIVYTHSHGDHTGGARVFAGNDDPEIYSHQPLLESVPDIGRAGRDGGDQFGMALPDSLYINAGVQMQFGRITPPTREGYLPPTRTFSGDESSLTIAGVRLQLSYTPSGRTPTSHDRRMGPPEGCRKPPEARRSFDEAVTALEDPLAVTYRCPDPSKDEFRFLTLG